MKRVILFSAVALVAVAGCSNPLNEIKGQCSSNQDCSTGKVCNTSGPVGVCVAACGDNVCEANQTCVNGSCVATTCIPGCTSNEQCDTKQSPPVCKPLPDGTIAITTPATDAVVGGPQIGVTATAGAPDGVTKVRFRIEQGGVEKAFVEVVGGNNGVFSGTMNITAGALTTGAANIIGQVFWTQNGAAKSKDSAPVPVQVDAQSPAVTNPTNENAWYSSTATPAQTAVVTVQINDVGPAGVASGSANVTVGTHTYSPATIPSGGAGAYKFAIPVGDFGIAANTHGTGAYTVNVTDKVGNVTAFTGGSVPVDNKAPTFANTSAGVSTTWYGAATQIPVSTDVTDPTGGSGLVPTSVKLSITGGQGIDPSGTNGATRTWTPLGSDLQAPDTQGSVTLTLSAADLAGNQGSTQAVVKIDRAAPTVTSVSVTANPLAGTNGYYKRDTTGATTIPVSVTLSDGAAGAGSGPSSATLTVNGQTVTSTGSAPSGADKTFTFLVPTSLAPANAEAPLSFQVNGADVVNNAVTATPTQTLKIDNLGPVVSGVQVNGADATVSNVAWFKQSNSSNIDVQATITDGGSGLSAANLQLTVVTLNGSATTAARLDTGPPTNTAGTNVWHFSVPRANATVAAGSQGLIGFKVVATDNLGNAQQADAVNAVSAGQLGIDGKAPTVTFDPTGQYPAADCDVANANAAGTSIYCGHDGKRFYRRGDDGATLGFTAADGSGGSGVPSDASVGGCSAPGQATCTVSYDANGSRFTFAIRPSQLTFSSDDNGQGTASVTVTAKDAVGNQGSVSGTIAITRVKWIRTLALGQFKVAPVLTPPIGAERMLLIAGNGVGASGDTIGALNTRGGVVKTVGGGQVTGITTNMAYSPRTNLLYAATDNSQKLFAYQVTTTGVTLGWGCDLSAGKQISGAPAIIGTDAASERVLIGENSTHRLLALTGTVGSTCDLLGAASATVGTGSVSWPTSDGANVYVVTQGNQLSKVSYSSGAFGTPVTKALGFRVVGNVAVAGSSLFFADNNTGYHAFLNDFTLSSLTNLWTATGAGAMLDIPLFSPVLTSSTVYGAAGTNDGSLRGFGYGDGAQQFAFSPATGKPALAIPAIGSEIEPALYFSDATGQFNAIVKSGSSAVLAPHWSKAFVGAAIGSPAQDLSFTNYTSPATLAQDGTVYFGADNGRVYALMTDSAPLPSSSANWPRIGYDNCNSSNSSYTNCQ